MDSASQLLLGQSATVTSSVDQGSFPHAQANGNKAKSDANTVGKPFSAVMAETAATEQPPINHELPAVMRVQNLAASSAIQGQINVSLLVDGGNQLQLAGELLPGLLPQSMAGWVVNTAGISDSTILEESPVDPETIDLELMGVGDQTALILGSPAVLTEQHLPQAMAQQIAWQTPAALQTADQARLVLAQNTNAPSQVLPQQYTGLNMEMISAQEKPIQEQSVLATAMTGQQESAQGAITGPAILAGNQATDKNLKAANAQPSPLVLNMQSNTSFTVSKLESQALLNAAQLAVAQAQLTGDKTSDTHIEQLQNSITALQTGYPKAEGGLSYQQATAANFQTSVSTPVMAQGWGDTVMQRVMWMSSQQIRSAEIQLDPPELGSLMVKINTVHEQTTVNFSSPHASVREALDQNLPRLKELMQEQGIDLVNVDVSDHSRQGRANQGESEEDQSKHAEVASVSQTEPGLTSTDNEQQAHRQDIGIINAYA